MLPLYGAISFVQAAARDCISFDIMSHGLPRNLFSITISVVSSAGAFENEEGFLLLCTAVAYSQPLDDVKIIVQPACS